MSELSGVIDQPKNAFEKLESVTQRILEKLKNTPRSKHKEVFSFEDYHGFSKTRLPGEMLDEVLEGSGLKVHDVQIEVVGVNSDLTNEVHMHRDSDAFVVVLGKEMNFSEPKKAKKYHEGDWVDVNEGEEVRIPKGTPHGFTVEDGGSLYFLSVQSPPIVDEHGEDDYVKVES